MSRWDLTLTGFIRGNYCLREKGEGISGSREDASWTARLQSLEGSTGLGQLTCVSQVQGCPGRWLE